MRIDGVSNSIAPITTHIAQAYGLPRAQPAMPPESMPAAGAVNKLPANAQTLVAGRVNGPVEFDGVSVPRSHPAALSLYSRAADRIEAATAVHIGRTIDIKA